MTIGRLRRATLTTPSTTAVANISWKENNDRDRSQGDTQLSGDPVLMRKGVTGTIELLSGALPTDRYGQNMVAVLEDVDVSAGSEVITNRTYTFDKVCFNRGVNSANDAQRGGISVEFEAATVTES